MKRFIPFLLIFLFALYIFPSSANDGTKEGSCAAIVNPDGSAGSCNQITDDVYVLTPFESVSISNSSTWTDNRHRAYYNNYNVNGFLLFDVTNIPDNALILSMNLLCHLENAFGSPSSNPVVDIYWSDDDNWTRYSVTGGQLSLNDLLVDNIPFTSYIPTYNFTPDIFAHDWTVDLLDNQICLGFKNDVTYYSYVYFYGAYGTPTGPPPELTIVTTDGTPEDVTISLIPVNPPIIIPAGGGSFEFEVEITNLEPASSTFHAWIMATLPNGSTYGPIIVRVVTLGTGGVILRTMSQGVPANAPPGDYVYSAFVGVYPDIIWNSSSFDFTKSADFDGLASSGEDWEIEGWDSGYKAASIPTQSISLSANPNPFNPHTDLVFQLPESGNISLAVYDVTGREVVKLAEGWYNEGSCQFSFDGSQLSSGIYFARLVTESEAFTHKILLVK
ncbi:MAG: T9SS type A sorting domain-containing protein [candidate division Zixibacteria bacterium]|nr:T9SS type A sorting domain-containing protein [Candidatus Tariuqbacter arcticus]